MIFERGAVSDSLKQMEQAEPGESLCQEFSDNKQEALPFQGDMKGSTELF